jgi:hypothetical protein
VKNEEGKMKSEKLTVIFPSNPSHLKPENNKFKTKWIPKFKYYLASRIE